MSEMKQPFVYGGFITADKIVAGSITTERIEMGKYYKNVDEWQMAIRKWNNINKDLEIISSPTLEAEYTDFTYGSNAFAEDNVPEVSDLEVREVKYPILFKEECKPYVVIELIKDLEYGIVDIDERKTIKKVPLDLNVAIDTCKFWNGSVKPEHEHVHEFRVVSDELGMLHSTCWCGEDEPSPATPAFAPDKDIVAETEIITWNQLDWLEKLMASTLLTIVVVLAGLVCFGIVVLIGMVF